MGFCLVHMLHIAAGELVSLSGSRGASLSYVSSLYSTSKLFKTPGYFLRVLDNLWDVVDHYLIIKTAARPCLTCFFVVVVCSTITNSSSSRNPVACVYNRRIRTVWYGPSATAPLHPWCLLFCYHCYARMLHRRALESITRPFVDLSVQARQYMNLCWLCWQIGGEAQTLYTIVTDVAGIAGIPSE